MSDTQLELADADTIAVKGPKATAADMIAALDKRYEQETSEKWVRIIEARSGAGFAGNNRQCDYLAVNTWQSGGLQVIGHEVKVSYGDWKRELADTDKAETFARFCRRWWVVAPSELAKRIKPELPPAWGLLGVSDKGVCREVVAAPARTPELIPPMWWVGWLAQVDRRQRRREGHELNAEVSRRVAVEKESWERAWRSMHDRSSSSHTELVEKVRKFEATTGVSILGGYLHSWDRLARLQQIARDAPGDIGVALDNARKAIDALTQVVSAEATP